jgi:uncharacterized protein
MFGNRLECESVRRWLQMSTPILATELVKGHPAFTLPAGCSLAVTPGLYFSRRGRDLLLVEPESASWCILSQDQWNVLRRLCSEMPLATAENVSGRRTDNWPAGPEGSRLHSRDCPPAEELNRLLALLYSRNMISLNGQTYYEPRQMWDTQRYPHYFNLHMTEACNLACKYCRVDSPKVAPMMSSDTCRRIIRRILEEIPSPTAMIGFHGGEPMLDLAAIEAGIDESRRVVERANKKVSFAMQTNGTMLSPKTVARLKKLNVSVGVSIDGPPRVHDKVRVFRDGHGSSDRVRHGIRAARRYGLEVGFLAVVHDPADYVDVLDYMVRELGARSVRLNYSALEGRAKGKLMFPVDRAESFAREWIKLLDYAEAYHKDTGVWLDISDLNLFITHLVSKERPHMCYRSPCGLGNAILGFSDAGQIYLCEEMIGNSLFRIGDISSATPLSEQMDRSETRANLLKARCVENVSKCASCTWRRFHGAGCTAKVFAYFGTVTKEDPMCRFYSVIFEELMWRLWNKPELVSLMGQYEPWPMMSFGIAAAHS